MCWIVEYKISTPRKKKVKISISSLKIIKPRKRDLYLAELLKNGEKQNDFETWEIIKKDLDSRQILRKWKIKIIDISFIQERGSNVRLP